MRAGFFQHLNLFILVVCACGLPPAARADGAQELPLLERFDDVVFSPYLVVFAHDYLVTFILTNHRLQDMAVGPNR